MWVFVLRNQKQTSKKDGGLGLDGFTMYSVAMCTHDQMDRDTDKHCFGKRLIALQYIVFFVNSFCINKDRSSGNISSSDTKSIHVYR